MKKVKIVRVSVPKNPIGYKVVLKDGQKLVSCSKSGLRVQYIGGKFAVPRTYGGPLTLFTNKYSAIGFIEKLAKFKDPELCRVYRAEFVPTECVHVWRYRNGGLKAKSISELPVNTVLARKVKLLDKVF